MASFFASIAGVFFAAAVLPGALEAQRPPSHSQSTTNDHGIVNKGPVYGGRQTVIDQRTMVQSQQRPWLNFQLVEESNEPIDWKEAEHWGFNFNFKVRVTNEGDVPATDVRIGQITTDIAYVDKDMQPDVSHLDAACKDASLLQSGSGSTIFKGKQTDFPQSAWVPGSEVKSRIGKTGAVMVVLGVCIRLRVNEAPQPTKQTDVHSPIQNDHGIVNEGPVTGGSQTVNDNRSYNAPQPAPKLLNVRYDALSVSQAPVPPRQDRNAQPGGQLTEQEMQWKEAAKYYDPRRGNPGLKISFSIDRSFQNRAFLLQCDRSCLVMSSGMYFTGRGISGSSSASASGSNRHLISSDEVPLARAGSEFTIEVRSHDSSVPRISSLQCYIE